jgi:hypothetical protein
MVSTKWQKEADKEQRSRLSQFCNFAIPLRLVVPAQDTRSNLTSTSQRLHFLL